jgi:hypothetical protein
MNIVLRAKYPLFLSDFSETWIFWTDFRKTLKYQTSRKSVQWEPSFSTRTEGLTEGGTVAFRNFGNVPKNWLLPIISARQVWSTERRNREFESCVDKASLLAFQHSQSPHSPSLVVFTAPPLTPANLRFIMVKLSLPIQTLERTTS